MITYEKNKHMEITIFERTKTGHDLCGDQYTVIHTDRYTICAVVDGLGSGKGAYEAAIIAIETIKAVTERSASEIVDACNKTMLKRRGVVITVIKIDYATRTISYSNVGNVRFILYRPNDSVIKPMPSRGFLSGKKRVVASKTFAYEPESVFVLFTDGIDDIPENILFEQPHDNLFTQIDHKQDDAVLLIGKFI